MQKKPVVLEQQPGIPVEQPHLLPLEQPHMPPRPLGLGYLQLPLLQMPVEIGHLQIPWQSLFPLEKRPVR